MQSRSAAPVVWWVRRDLRVRDNQALATASARSDGAVLPVFVVDRELVASRWHRAARRRRAFLAAGLRALDGELRARGSALVVRHGRPADVLPALVAETRATAVVAEADYAPYARRRDAAAARTVPLELVGGPTVHHPADVVKADGGPYTVFTPFRAAWLGRRLPTPRDLVAAPERLQPVPPRLLVPLPDAEAPAAFPAGEVEARRRLAAFARGADAPIRRYAADRDRLDRDGTSTLSPYLRFGMLSAREAVVAALAARARPPRAGADAWLSELVWREFYLAILFHFPDVLHGAFVARLRTVPWREAPAEVAAWRAGRTGYPIVDAAMRQLAAIGWMPNRARMIAASFLTKDLLVDWRVGEAWFMRELVDGDPAANNGGWQWTAGVGTDAAPYFRVFNPVLQGKRFDPKGAYVKRWVPELAGMPSRHVHEPWTLPAAAQEAAGCVVGRDYPARIVDHRDARARSLAAYRRAQ